MIYFTVLLRIVYDKDVQTFDQFLDKDKSFCIQHQTIQSPLIAFACNAKMFTIVFLFTPAFNAKSFAIAIIFFFLFLLPIAVFGQTIKKILSMFHILLRKTRVTSIELISLDALVIVFILFLFTVIPDADGE